MSDAKDYLDFQESSSNIRSVLEQLTNISSTTFIDEPSELESALEIEALLESTLIQFFLEKDLRNTPILDFYKSLDRGFDVQTEKSVITQYYGGDLNQSLNALSDDIHDTLGNLVNQDWVYGIYSNYSLIKAAMGAWHSLKKAILAGVEQNSENYKET